MAFQALTFDSSSLIPGIASSYNSCIEQCCAGSSSGCFGNSGTPSERSPTFLNGRWVVGRCPKGGLSHVTVLPYRDGSTRGGTFSGIMRGCDGPDPASTLRFIRHGS